MKLNQFARLTPAAATQIKELAELGFAVAPELGLAKLARTDFALLFPEAHTATTKAQQLQGIAIDDHTTLLDLLQPNLTAITRQQFYAAALQLLGFEGLTDFKLEDPLRFAAATKLPVVDSDITTPQQFLAALYLLLTTRTKHLVNYLDALATRGFFKDFQGDTPRFLFFNGKAQNVFDPRRIHREVVWIESDLDTDHDGQRDLLEATIFRPLETDAGLRVPVLFTANPYFHGTNDVDWITHKPSDTVAVKTHSRTLAEVTAKPAPQPALPHREVKGERQTAEVYGDENGIYPLNDYFLARGFATVYAAGIGTRGSDGVRETGGPGETASAVAVIEWLTGARRAFTNRTDNIEIKAWWSNGKVAMTGKSYLGTLAVAAATSGVEGLKTVISESAISSWYDYYRENGLVVAPGGFQGEDADVLAVDTYSRQKNTGDYLKMKPTWDKALAAITRDQDRTTGDYTAWWDARNYRNDLANITCDVVSTHGLNDWNVKPKNVIKLWDGLRDLPINKKLILHQGQHVYVNNVLSLDFTDMMNLWLSYELLDVQNDAPKVLPNVLVQDNVEEQTWHAYEDFGAGPKHREQTLNLASDLTSSRASFADTATQIFTANHETSDSFELEIVKPKSLYDTSRLWLDLPNFDDTVTLEGTPHIKLRLWVDQPTAILSVRLVDVGEAERFGTTAKLVEGGGYPLGYDYKTTNILEFAKVAPTASKLITFGHANVQNQHNAYENVPVVPGEPFTIDFDLQPTHLTLPAARHLALIIHGADMAQTHRPVAVTNYHVDLAQSTLTLPLRSTD
ncbi:Xaa-Pro dipeptidyl-peptidase [Lacticaseibacillus parakribbianus]|uniref:Xaa-Pro dipeptidyl-peptidase n=1 Tax=Lacticaseibacillus parakribbianus TaxID=2970927 RepID=UPI0021CB2CF8|nr:Xaa-Pro dipeptidyl-peptidase [Lacticaseibacillus parakribbianus]